MLAVRLSTPQRINLLFNPYHMMYKLGLIVHPGQNFIKQDLLGRGLNFGSTFNTPQRINLLFNAFHMMYKLGLIVHPGQNLIKLDLLRRGSNVGSTFNTP